MDEERTKRFDIPPDRALDAREVGISRGSAGTAPGVGMFGRSGPRIETDSSGTRTTGSIAWVRSVSPKTDVHGTGRIEVRDRLVQVHISMSDSNFGEVFAIFQQIQHLPSRMKVFSNG